VGPLAPWQLEHTSGAGAFTVSIAVRVTPPAAAVMVTLVAEATEVVATVKVAVVAPAATVTEAGTVADALLEERVTAVPPAGAAAVSVTVPVDDAPPVTEAGLTETAERVAVVAGVHDWLSGWSGVPVQPEGTPVAVRVCVPFAWQAPQAE
jgi:hypothetical protein